MIIDGVELGKEVYKNINYWDERVNVPCPKCGRFRLIMRKHILKAKKQRCRRCFMDGRIKSLPSDKAFAWKGGRQERYGYVLIYIKDTDPLWCMARQAYNGKILKSGYIFEHRYVMAKHLGRPLAKNELVHHKNGKRNDNRLENLTLTTRAKHKMGFGEAYQDGYEVGYCQGYKDALSGVKAQYGI